MRWPRALLATAVIPLMGCFETSPPLPPPHHPDATVPMDPPPPPVIDSVRRLEPIVTAAAPPPPIAGGTLHYAERTDRILASDPDRDVVWIVDAASARPEALMARVELEPGDEPGRVAEVGDRYWVVLPSGRGVASNDATTYTVTRHPTGATPRGIAGDGTRVHVTCASGALVTLDAHDGSELRRLELVADLRDVVVRDEGVYVSTYRQPRVLRLDADGRVVQSTSLERTGETVTHASLAWQMVANPSGPGVVIAHQGVASASVSSTSTFGAYGTITGTCTMVNRLGISYVFPEADASVWPVVQIYLGPSAIPVSLAMRDTKAWVVDAGALNDGSTDTLGFLDRGVFTLSALGNLPPLPADILERPDQVRGSSALCVGSNHEVFETPPHLPLDDGRQVVAVAATPRGMWIQSRDPWQLVGPDGGRLDLDGVNRKDTGHDLFHERANAQIACATCHGEGGDDGQVWMFDGTLPRRTHDLRGGLLATAPFHWDGSRPDLQAIMGDIFSTRMGGPELPPAYVEAVARWTDAMPMPPREPTGDDADRDQGRVWFEDPTVGCAGCHAGAHYTNNLQASGALQVPSLVGVAHRVGLMHHACAERIEDTVTNGPCGALEGTHGDVRGLDAVARAQLFAYVRGL